MKPATEPPVLPGVTERRRQVALAGHTGRCCRRRRRTRATPAPSVRATALGALHRLGALHDDDLAAGPGRPGAPRCAVGRASWPPCHPGWPSCPLLDDADPSVVEMAAWSLGERRERAAVPALCRTGLGRLGPRRPLCREAAVAALGAIGDPAGLPAVLGALDDKPAIRRRAAVALAAFDGPDGGGGAAPLPRRPRLAGPPGGRGPAGCRVTPAAGATVRTRRRRRWDGGCRRSRGTARLPAPRTPAGWPPGGPAPRSRRPADWPGPGAWPLRPPGGSPRR